MRAWVFIPLLLVAPAAASAQDALQPRINLAIKKGVDALLGLPVNDRGLIGEDVGLSALVAWTMLESDVSPKHDKVNKMAEGLRKEAVTQNHTYTISLLILFLDRLGDPADQPLIESLALRLLAAQGSTGGWTYHCTPPDEKDKTRLLDEIDKGNELRRKGETGPAKLRPAARKPKEPSAAIKKAVKTIEDQTRQSFQHGDNSNTQFAMLALWVARRNGVPVDAALTRVVERFRNSQQANGGWGYVYNGFDPKGLKFPSQTTSTMSCAGLLGLALGHGINAKATGKPANLKDDPFVKRGLAYVNQLVKDANGPIVKPLTKVGYIHYFFFTLERMAVIYDLKKIGDRDWYLWGAKFLVDMQQPTGHWFGEHGTPDTCFALLFLKRANVAEDLTFNLLGITRDIKKKSKQPDPDPFDFPKFIPKDKKKSKGTKGAMRHDPEAANAAASLHRRLQLRGNLAFVANPLAGPLPPSKLRERI